MISKNTLKYPKNPLKNLIYLKIQRIIQKYSKIPKIDKKNTQKYAKYPKIRQKSFKIS